MTVVRGTKELNAIDFFKEEEARINGAPVSNWIL